MTMSACCKQDADLSGKIKMQCQDYEDLFDSFFTVLLNDLISQELNYKQTSDAFRWYQRVNEYNVPTGHKVLGKAVLHFYRSLIGSDQVTDEGLKIACVIGWCIEWLLAFCEVTDDILDASTTRRGKLCWYKQREVGLTAINDGSHLNAAIFVLFKTYLKGASYYMHIVELFHEAFNQNCIGQTLDMITASKDRTDFSNYTMERWEVLIKHRNAFIGYLPVGSAMYMVGVTDKALHSKAETIMLSAAKLWQIHDDYRDCYADPNVTGKISTDIEENKITWLIIEALKRANPAQREILELNYGRREDHHIAAVYQIYADLSIESVYKQWEQESREALFQHIDTLCPPTEMTRHDMTVTSPNTSLMSLLRDALISYVTQLCTRLQV